MTCVRACIPDGHRLAEHAREHHHGDLCGDHHDQGSLMEFRALRPSRRAAVETPNPNPPGVPPASVGVPDYVPGDPNGFEIIDEGPSTRGPTRFTASPWTGWPAEWSPPILGQ